MLKKLFKKMGFDTIDINRKKSLIRSDELDMIAIDDIKHKSSIRTGFSEYSQGLYENTKSKILDEYQASEDDWINPKWQMKNRICDVDEIAKFSELTAEEYENIEKVSDIYRFAITDRKSVV